MAELNPIETEHRITKVEEKVDTILTNHLPHIQTSVDEVNSKLQWLIGLLVAGMISLVFAIVKKKIGF